MTAPALPHNVGAQFQARFDGNCKDCDAAIYEGDLMGWVDEVAVCRDDYQAAELANRLAQRDQVLKWQEEQRERDMAADPERTLALETAASRWVAKVRASAAREPGKEWVTSPGSTPGWVRNPDYEPPTDKDTTVTTETIEPGIAALMAAGLLSGQEPGGSGVCDATITDGAGKVTEVAIPVPVDPPVKTRAPRKSRAKVKPEVPSTDTVGDPGVAVESVTLTPGGVGMGSIELDPHAERRAQLEENAKDWHPGQIEADVLAARGINVHGPAPTPPPVLPEEDAEVTPLQAGLHAAVTSGAMSRDQATALGWVDPLDPWATVTPPSASVQMAQDDVAMASMATQEEARTDAPVLTGPPPAASPRTVEPLQEFRADPSTDRASLFLDALSQATTLAEEDAILEALDTLPAYAGGFNHDSAKKEILGILQEAINYHPRSLQKKIGPSEIGTECDHCLAAKLAGWEQVDRDAWLPTVGTAVHSWIESAFGRISAGPAGTRRFLTERRVSVGEIDGVEITGSTDLVDTVLGATWDWKIVGPTTLKSAKTGPSWRYVVQQMLYGRGWNRLGVKVTQVGIAYLPRNAMSLSAGVWWSAPYDESIAVAALERASGFARNVRALASIGPEAVDKYVTGLPRWRLTRVDGKAVEGNGQEGQITCLDCARYKDYPADPAKALAQLDGLM